MALTKPISISQIARTLGVASNDLGTLFKHGNVNMWAKYKPVDLYNTLTHGFKEGDSNYKIDFGARAEWWKGANGDCGIKVSVVKTDNFDKNTLKAFIDENAKQDGTNGWIHLIPTVDASHPARIDDFVGYDHNATNPFTGQTTTELGEKNYDEPITISIMPRINSKESSASLSLADLKVALDESQGTYVDLKTFFAAVIVCTKSGSSYNVQDMMTSEETIAGMQQAGNETASVTFSFYGNEMYPVPNGGGSRAKNELYIFFALTNSRKAWFGTTKPANGSDIITPGIGIYWLLAQGQPFHVTLNEEAGNTFSVNKAMWVPNGTNSSVNFEIEVSAKSSAISGNLEVSVYPKNGTRKTMTSSISLQKGGTGTYRPTFSLSDLGADELSYRQVDGDMQQGNYLYDVSVTNVTKKATGQTVGYYSTSSSNHRSPAIQESEDDYVKTVVKTGAWLNKAYVCDQLQCRIEDAPFELVLTPTPSPLSDDEDTTPLSDETEE